MYFRDFFVVSFFAFINMFHIYSLFRYLYFIYIFSFNIFLGSSFNNIVCLLTHENSIIKKTRKIIINCNKIKNKSWLVSFFHMLKIELMIINDILMWK